MRISYVTLVIVLGFGLASCNRRDTPRRGDSAARQVGREAYDASQDIKRGARKAAKELREAGKELRQGWNEAKREDPARNKKQK